MHVAVLVEYNLCCSSYPFTAFDKFDFHQLILLLLGTHEWRKFIQPQELAQWIRDEGLEVEEVTGMIYHPFKGTFHLEPHDIDVNYFLCAKKKRRQ